jgi:hypothetical protein
MTYKKILKSLKVAKDVSSLYKSEEGEHPLNNRKPHFIFSAENPMHEVKYEMSHEDMINNLKTKGYKIHELEGKYNNKNEKSIMVENPKPHAVKALMEYASNLGQDSAIYSDGRGSHEFHYLNGANKGKHHKGFGTNTSEVAPDDNFSTMEDGSIFSHSFNFDKLHDRDKSMLRQHFIQEHLKKSENSSVKKAYIPSSLSKSEETGKETKLIHYSPKKNLKEISTSFHGSNVRTTGERGAPEHKLAFFYREGAAPEQVVTSGANSKYVTKLDHGHRLYDLGEDSLGVRSAVKEKANKKMVNPGAFTNDDIHSELKDRGYHGFFNTKSALPSVVAMFHPMSVHAEHELHPNDFKEVSADNHHNNDKTLKSAEKYAKETGHNNPKFLASLVTEK